MYTRTCDLKNEWNSDRKLNFQCFLHRICVDDFNVIRVVLISYSLLVILKEKVFLFKKFDEKDQTTHSWPKSVMTISDFYFRDLHKQIKEIVMIEKRLTL